MIEEREKYEQIWVKTSETPPQTYSPARKLSGKQFSCQKLFQILRKVKKRSTETGNWEQFSIWSFWRTSFSRELFLPPLINVCTYHDVSGRFSFISLNIKLNNLLAEEEFNGSIEWTTFTVKTAMMVEEKSESVGNMPKSGLTLRREINWHLRH